MEGLTRNAFEAGSEKDNEAFAQAAVVALRHAVMELEQVAGILAEHKRIWSQVAMDYAPLARADLRMDIEAFIQTSRAQRIEAYSHPAFQAHVLSMTAQWYALQLIADEYRSAIQAASVNMGRTYTKNPTIEEARQLALLLSATIDQQVAAEVGLRNTRNEEMASEQQAQSPVIE